MHALRGMSQADFDELRLEITSMGRGVLVTRCHSSACHSCARQTSRCHSFIRIGYSEALKRVVRVGALYGQHDIVLVVVREAFEKRVEVTWLDECWGEWTSSPTAWLENRPEAELA